MTGNSEITPPRRPTAEVWSIPRRVWFVLLSWGMAGLLFSGLISWWIWHEAREQDKAMCTMLELIVSGPEPVAGPAGERGRAVLAAIRAYRATLHCE